MTNNKIVLIDGSSLAFRAFFSILDVERFKNRAGLHTNALYTFKRMLDNILAQFEPSHVLVAFDKSEHTFRTDKYSAYKAGRKKTPSEFKEQMPYFPLLLDGYGIKHYAISGYEADDIIGTLAHQADLDDEVIIISGDKDLIQLASQNTTVYITRKGVSDLEPYTPQIIEEKYQLSPEQIIDLKGLMGDSSDNYPGITKVGEKTALKLLHQFQSVEAMYERLDELKPSKMKENIIADEASARMSKDLARILLDAPLEISISDIKKTPEDRQSLIELYSHLEFKSFLKDLDAQTLSINESGFTHPVFERKVLDSIQASDLPEEAAIYFEMLEENYHFGHLIRVAWTDIEAQKTYLCSPQVAFSSQLFTSWLSRPIRRKISYDSKRDCVIAHLNGASLEHLSFDVVIATYLIDQNQSQRIEDIQAFLGQSVSVQSQERIYGKGAKQAIPEDESVIDEYVASKVEAISFFEEALLKKLEAIEAMDLFNTMEMPLARVLAKMEIQGVKVEVETLSRMNEDLLERLSQLESEIYKLAGREFNISSPKQLGEVLFDDLKLPPLKKTKTGYSTAADVLEKLQHYHPIVEKLIDYRQISKLQGTYLVGLPKFIKEDGKIHTRFVQTLTQTGRLSSTDPNLQNIPIKLEEGHKIRQAFVASQPGWQLIGADYSQIELRVLAHMSKDSHMQEAFIKDEDIHAATARRVFGLDESQEVTGLMRRQAKAVNFGIVYGISDYGLSQNLNITRKEAQLFIDRYMEQYPNISSFMHDIVEQAKVDGYVATLFNRRRYLPDIHASNFNVRSFAERTAMNSPIQGSAADIIKMAMILLDRELTRHKLAANLLLQVHDELILEAPESEMPLLLHLLPQVMENAVNLVVPLKVDAHVGDNWYDLK